MRRLILGAFLGALLAIPVTGGAVALGVGQAEEPAGVPAGDCPEAVAAMERAGVAVRDYFVPGCPSGDALEFDSPRPAEDVLAIDRACAKYEAKPTWCPSRDEVAAASGETGR